MQKNKIGWFGVAEGYLKSMKTVPFVYNTHKFLTAFHSLLSLLHCYWDKETSYKSPILTYLTDNEFWSPYCQWPLLSKN